jgi:hypothetical protein
MIRDERARHEREMIVLNEMIRHERKRHYEEICELEARLQHLQTGQEIRIAQYKPHEGERKTDK